MNREKKFNPQRFRSLMSAKLKERGLNVNSFTRTYGFQRVPLARAMIGVSRPSAESLINWCKALECTPEERDEITASVFDDELEEESAA